MVLFKNKRILVLYALVFAFALFTVSVKSAQAANLYFSPASGSYTIGQTFVTSVYVSSTSQEINAVSGIISFPNDKLEVISLSKSNSIVNLWVQEPSFSNSAGIVNFEGVILNPGFIGSNGKILSITFRVKKIGAVKLFITQGSVLANDGSGTEILSNLFGANFDLLAKVISPTPSETKISNSIDGTPIAPEVFSSTHPDPNEWYPFTSAKFSWKVGKDINGVRTLINKNPRSLPNVTYLSPLDFKEVSDLEEGIWYFHIRFRNKQGWGDISHFPVRIDKTPPKPFAIKVDNEGDATNPRPLLVFEAIDSLSGIDRYEIKINQEDLSPLLIELSSKDISSGAFRLPVTSPGKHSIIIRALDKAGNYSLAMTEIDIKPIEAPVITDCPKTLYPGNLLILKGKSLPKTTVNIFIRNERKEIITDVATSDKKGYWDLALARTLDRGIYEIWAQTTDYRGAKSNYSNKLRIIISPPIFVRIGNLVIDYLSVIISLIALIISMAMIWVYAWRKIKLLQKRLKKETIEAEEALAEAFNILRKKTKDEIAKLDGQVGLSKKEEQINKELRKALKVSEKLIAKEIKDIKNEINNR